MYVEGQLTNLGEPTGLLEQHGRRIRGTGIPRARASTEPHRLGDELPETAGHKRTEAARYREGSESEPTRDGPEAVLAERSTDGRGEKTEAE